MGRYDDFLLTALTRGHQRTLAASHRRFLRCASDPQRAARRWLLRFLAKNRSSSYGRLHDYDRIDSIRQFQDRVPIVDYEVLRPWVDRIADGEPNVLTTAPVQIFERSSGTTGGDKLVPYTSALLYEFNAAVNPWLYDLYAQYPSLHGTTSYWSVSPASREEKRTRSGIPVGFDDDTAYFGTLERIALARMMAVPGTVARIPDLDEWRFETAAHLLADRRLGLISVWHPSFLTLLMEAIDANLEELIRRQTPERAKEIRRTIDRTGRLHDIWPRLTLISCWTEGHAKRFVPAMQRWFEGVRIQPKGLLATEGVVSFPYGDSCVLAASSHLLEMVDLDRPDRRPLLPDELEVGGRYAPLLTTSGGFVRYRLYDEVHCVGRFRNTARVAFVGKLDRTSDVCGEKLTAGDVDRALETITLSPEFVLVAPSLEPARYVAYVEGLDPREAEVFAADLDRKLSTSFHYRYARDLGQLGPVEAVRVDGGRARFERALVERGARAGDLKPTHLDAGLFWSEVFRSEK